MRSHSMRSRRLLALSAVVAAVTMVMGTLLGPHIPRPSADRTGDPLVAGRLAELASDGDYHHLSVAVVTPEVTKFAGLGADERTSMEIGSITKTMTSLLLIQAEGDDVLDITDPASKYLELGTQPFTLEELASHRSGLPRIESGIGAFLQGYVSQLRGSDPYTGGVEELVSAARGSGLSGAGSVSYSNMGVAVLGQAVASARGLPYEQVLSQGIFKPLGMSDSFAPVSSSGLTDDAPRGFTSSGRSADPWTGNAHAPAGGVRSTAADMARYASALLTADPALRVDPAASLDPRYNDDDGGSIGLAWFIDERDGRTITWHNGATGGYRSMLVLDRAAGTAVYIAGDTANGPVEGIAHALLAEATRGDFR